MSYHTPLQDEAARAVGSGGGIYSPDIPVDIDDVDTEADKGSCHTRLRHATRASPPLTPRLPSAAASAEDGAHRLAYIEAVFHVINGYYLLPLNDAIILAGLILVTMKGKVSDADRAAVESNPRHHLEAYRSHLPEVIAAQAIAEHKATSGKGVEDLAVRIPVPRIVRPALSPHLLRLNPSQIAIRREHLRLSAVLEPLNAQRALIKRVRQLPEFGASFYTATVRRQRIARHKPARCHPLPLAAPTLAVQLVRLPGDRADSKGSRSAPETPEWAERLTTDNPHSASAPAPLPVLIAINALGVLMRPMPPMHSPSVSYMYGPSPVGADGAFATLSHEASASERLSPDGKPVGWMTHPVHYIEVRHDSRPSRAVLRAAATH